ncbi:DEKNAAC104196 [Brettanomyces naardenensis]|uniref:DEKNAAC104196 n=1 Tax=Brettanomyces naardenensis TaxID=13370 RepID=A0A448YPY5_BRENA|nr:DEKNAAC104196 [Brettanomyces naardenensis]
MQVIKRRIPGERDQTNSIQDRFPSSWHFEQEAVPTLLPRPGVPEPNKLALAKMYQLLKLKKEPELIYEAEPHKLYFVFCYAFAFVFIIYAVNALSIGWDLTNRMFESNDNNLAGWKLDLEYVMHAVIVVVLGCLPLGIGFGFLGLPTRLIRRIWYLPAGAGRQAYVRFTTHPLLPNRPTPVRTMPIGTLQKSISAKIYSGKGFYGVNDSSFFFFLRENGKRIPFIADRKGFFWGDGRLFDLIFSNDTVDEVENSKKIDEAYGDMLKERRSKEQEMKKQYGFGWRTKAAGKLMIDDVTKIKDMLTQESEVAVRDEPQKEAEKVTKRDRKKAASKKVAHKPSKHAQSRKAEAPQGGSKENHRL